MKAIQFRRFGGPDVLEIVDLDTLGSLDPYITTKGDVFRVHSVGFFAEGGATARVEALIDATQVPPQIIFQRDVSSLGPGYSHQLLSGSTGN